MEVSSVYIHIPFCKSICSYCDFCKFYYNKEWINGYLEALKNEISDRYMDEEIKTLYFGGGTPSSLNSLELEKLFEICKIFKLKSDAEITFECNLSDINECFLDILVKNKVNRLSIGIQSFDEKNLKFMNRKADFLDADKKIKLIKEKGIDNINVDLIYALPDESIKTLKKDLHLFSKLDITHISTYSLMIENNTLLSVKKTQGVEDALDAQMYEEICRFLKKKGFEHYEVSNFAKSGYESKHNLVYWNNEQYYGFGVGASGYIDNIRYDNTRSLTQYIKGSSILNQTILSQKDMMDYEIILGFRKLSGINIRSFHEKYHVNIQNRYPIKKLLEQKDLIYKDGNIFISPDKLYVMNEVLLKLV